MNRKRGTFINHSVLYRGAIAVSLMLIVISASARADLCALKNANYTLSSKYSLKPITASPNTGMAGSFTAGGLETARPCSKADDPDHSSPYATDDSIDLSFESGEDIIIDVVYEQDPVNQYKGLYFESVMFYDPVKMVVKTCNDDPADFFKDVSILGQPMCGQSKASDGVTPAVFSTGIQFSGDLWPADPANFVLDRVTFANTFSPGENVYTIDFEKDNQSHTVPQPTDVGLQLPGGGYCGILTGQDDCVAWGIQKQKIKTSRITIARPPCYIGAPPTASITCVGDSATCPLNPYAANATINLNYSIPTTCYLTPACDVPSTTSACAGISSANTAVQFKNQAGVDQPAEWDGNYKESTTTNPSNSIPSYTLVGVSRTGACMSSSSCSSPKTKSVSASEKCSCGAAPVVSPAPFSQFTSQYISNADIPLSYTITDTDKTGTIVADISMIKFYYTNDPQQPAQMVELDPATSISTTGKMTVKIDKSFNPGGSSIYCGVVVKDVMGLTAAYPSNFVVDEAGKISPIYSSEIPAENIHSPQIMAFTSSPYPNQFPFLAAADGNNMYQILFGVNAPASVTAGIYTQDGQLVRQIGNSAEPISISNPGCVEGVDCSRCNYATGCQWDGLNSEGAPVSNGAYEFRLSAVATGELFNGSTIQYSKTFFVNRTDIPFEYAGVSSAVYDSNKDEMSISASQCAYATDDELLGYETGENPVGFWFYKSSVPGGENFSAPSFVSATSTYTISSPEVGTHYFVVRCGVKRPGIIDTSIATSYVDISDNNTNELSATVDPPAGLTLRRGWNLIGVSASETSLNPQSLFASSAKGILAYKGQTNPAGALEWKNADSNEFLPEIAGGYWIYSENELGLIQVGGASFSAAYKDIPLIEGWNLFSNPYSQKLAWDSANAEMTCGTPPSPVQLPSIFSYKPTEGFNETTPGPSAGLLPWTGYFIKSASNCSLRIKK